MSKLIALSCSNLLETTFWARLRLVSDKFSATKQFTCNFKLVKGQLCSWKRLQWASQKVMAADWRVYDCRLHCRLPRHQRALWSQCSYQAWNSPYRLPTQFASTVNKPSIHINTTETPVQMKFKILQSFVHLLHPVTHFIAWRPSFCGCWTMCMEQSTWVRHWLLVTSHLQEISQDLLS